MIGNGNSRLRVLRKPGATLVETVAAAFLMGVAMLIVVQIVTTVARQQRLSRRRDLAVQEVANLMEQVSAMRWSQLTEEQLADLTVSESLQRHGGDPVLSAAIRAEAGPPAARQIQLSIDWNEADLGRSRPVQLTSWRFRRREDDR